MKFLLLFLLNFLKISSIAVNHWVLNEGKILQKIDSPFYMREPHNLIAFLDQIKHNDIIENTYLKLSRQRELMAEQINFSIKFGMDVIEQAKCAIKFYDIENALTYTKLTRKYLKRISLKKFYKNSLNIKFPYCWQYINISYGICCYDHIKSLQNINNLKIEPELELNTTDLDFYSNDYIKNIIGGLQKNPMSWKYYTLSSYYWRLNGKANEAIECAKRAIMLSPRKYRDIPLLSLGTILWKAKQIKDAEIIINAAVEHAPNISENQFSLGTIHAILYNYNQSIEHFNKAEQLDSTLIEKTKLMKEFVACIEKINKKTAKMYSYIEFIKKEVNGLKNMKNRIVTSHEKLMQQQVPLGSRYLNNLNEPLKNDELLHRGQYCSTRTLSDNNEPVLFCDFYSDLQMRLESKEVDIESLENELNANSEAIIKRLSVEFHTQFGFNKVKETLHSSEREL